MQNSDVVSIFVDIVKIDSPSGEESAMASYLQVELSKLGIASELDKSGNLFAKISGTGDPVLLNAHMDTVEPGRGITPMISDGVITSDGTTILGADNKVAIAAILAALKSVEKSKRRSLELIFSVREETDSGIAEFDFSKLKCKTGLVADRAEKIGSVVLASTWIKTLDITITGKPCHSSVPEDGISAITVATQAINGVKWGRIDPKTTSNIGMIHGGSAVNAVPESVKITGEIRSFSKESLEMYYQNVNEQFEKICQISNAKCQFNGTWYCSGYEYPKTDPAVTEIVSLMTKLNIKPFYENAFGASDANTFANKGIKVVTIGDGCEHPHTRSESISVANLELLKKLMINYIISPNE